MTSGTVAILTDFGDSDAYVGIMEAVMLRIGPQLRFIRLTQNVAPQDIRSASYLAATTWHWLPAGSVLLAVVDPGVGSGRQELIVEYGGHWLVCPDNGLVTLLLKLNPGARCSRLDDRIRVELLRNKPSGSNTFDGRDLFAPVAARLAVGDHEIVGLPVEPKQLPGLDVHFSPDGEATATILHADHFGNCITSIRAGMGAFEKSSLLEISFRGRKLRIPFGTTFSNVLAGEPIAYWGSTGFLEIGVRNGSASAFFGMDGGGEVQVRDCSAL